MKGAKIPEKNCAALTKTGDVKFKIIGHDSIRLLENENNTCHTSRSNIFLLQHEWKALFQCLQQADSALRKSMHIVYCTSCATGSQIQYWKQKAQNNYFKNEGEELGLDLKNNTTTASIKGRFVDLITSKGIIGIIVYNKIRPTDHNMLLLSSKPYVMNIPQHSYTQWFVTSNSIIACKHLVCCKHHLRHNHFTNVWSRWSKYFWWKSSINDYSMQTSYEPLSEVTMLMEYS